MNAVLLIVSVGVEYPALLSTVEWIGVVGSILRLKAQVFSSNLYNYEAVGISLFHCTVTLDFALLVYLYINPLYIERVIGSASIQFTQNVT
jgi:hypothetical protein